MTNFKSIRWSTDNNVIMLDQRLLPQEEKYVELKTAKEVTTAINKMIIRGAPAIGIAGAMAVALTVKDYSNDNLFLKNCQDIIKARPTAVNLSWAVERMIKVFHQNKSENQNSLFQILKDESQKILEEDVIINRDIGKNGSLLIENNSNIITHCNAGALATGGFGTALGVIRSACQQGKDIHVYAQETRPYLQGARLTVWELQKDNIPVTLICDNMSAHTIKNKKINAIVVGADRIASNGDTANKIGTLGLAILAKHYNIPFYVASPLSTIDFSAISGDDIIIEERNAQEVVKFRGKLITSPKTNVFNPAFDITPGYLISAIITEKAVFKGNYKKSLSFLKPL